MNIKKRGLGRNLNALLSRPAAAPVSSKPVSAPASVVAPEQPVELHVIKKEGELRQLPTELLQRGRYQPRKDMAPEPLQELADSIRAQGVIQPIVVRSIGQGRYEIIAGERRWRAVQLAGLTEIPAIIKDIPDEAASAVALIENIQREDLNPLEEAVALQRLIDEFNLTHQEVAEAVGKSRTTVTNLLRLLNLQPEVRALVEQGKLEMGHARTLLSLNSLQQLEAAGIIVAKGLSVRATEQLIKNWQAPEQRSQAIKQLDPNIRQLQQSLADKLGAPITFQHHAKGKGRLIISYSSLDELDGILRKIG